ncbi:hypothetical protein BO71DRAFT_427204 [Aspergillus ellipticus CBS 707.79]|uniref:Uncharacterized protein n=1 Tax=Aspergillus ellipticus CBS 707.79 TaxID=1448320 RepID=A0A319DIC8_9EURO|nr:hypothetical protein BO71DRAFT_427204 [Aspergillus ellipticus CBS 707.79]
MARRAAELRNGQLGSVSAGRRSFDWLRLAGRLHLTCHDLSNDRHDSKWRYHPAASVDMQAFESSPSLSSHTHLADLSPNVSACKDELANRKSLFVSVRPEKEIHAQTHAVGPCDLLTGSSAANLRHSRVVADAPSGRTPSANANASSAWPHPRALSCVSRCLTRVIVHVIGSKHFPEAFLINEWPCDLGFLHRCGLDSPDGFLPINAQTEVIAPISPSAWLAGRWG